MSFNVDNNSGDLKSFILHKNEPIVLSNILKWGMLNWTLDDWKSTLQGEQLLFRCGLNAPTEEPQWERQTKICEGDFNYFLTQSQSDGKEWLYFDYKQLNCWFKNNEKLKQEIDWSPLGFPDIKPEDSTIWIGSKGAHTPCHQDCYGFNLVYQIFGRKLWLLFPPEENLRPTRVPYEESSIYSKLYFFNPKVDDFKGLNKCRKIELTPGDVLLVPHKWWHYVENLETSISINVWLPSKEDDEERLLESVVQFFVKQITLLTNNEDNKKILNPNMDELILESNTNSFLDTLVKCKKICIENNKDKKVKGSGKGEQNIEVTKHQFGQTIPILSREQFFSFLENQNRRFDNVSRCLDAFQGDRDSDCIEFIESITNPEVVHLIKNILLKNKS